jgi:hypothetical protein
LEPFDMLRMNSAEGRIEAKVSGATETLGMTLLKNVLGWDGPPLRSTGVPSLFGVFPLRCQFADEKAPNKLGIPTGGSFFNKLLDTALRYASSLLDRRWARLLNDYPVRRL